MVISRIVYKKTGDRVTTSDNEWQPVTTNDNESQQMTRSGTTSDNKWYNEWQRVTKLDNEWQCAVISAFFWEESTSRYPKENPLNLKEDL